MDNISQTTIRPLARRVFSVQLFNSLDQNNRNNTQGHLNYEQKQVETSNVSQMSQSYYKNGLNRFPGMQASNIHTSRMIDSKRSVRKNQQSSSQGGSIWNNIGSYVTEEKTQGIMKKFNQLQQSLEKSVVPLIGAQPTKAKLYHLLNLFQQLAQVIEEFTLDKIENLMMCFIQQTSLLIRSLLDAGENNEVDFALKKTQIQSEILKKKQEQIQSVIEENRKIMLKEKKDLEDSRKSVQYKQADLQLTNQRLAQEIGILSKKLQDNEQNTNINLLQQRIINITNESQMQIDEISKERDLKDRNLFKCNQVIQQLKSTLGRIESELKYSNHQNEQLKMSNQKMKLKLDNLEKYFDQNREISLMGREDLNLQQMRIQQLQVQLEDQKLKHLQLRAKIDKFTIERTKIVEIPDNYPFASDEKKIQDLMTMFLTDKSYYILMKEAYEAEMLRKYPSYQAEQSFQKKKQEKAQEVDGGVTSISLSKYSYAKQNFLIFFEHSKKNIEMELKNIQERNIDCTFFGTMRAILDSKYNEFLYSDNFQAISSFADFVYSWLSNFQIDPQTRKIDRLSPGEAQNSDERKQEFLIDCLNPKMEKLWECLTFNDFLFEKNSSDELYLLFRGPSFHDSNATFNVIQYIKIEFVEFIVDLVLSKYDMTNVSTIKKNFREKARRINLHQTNLYLDIHFVLRVLLEYYKVERRNKFKLLKEIFSALQSLQQNGKLGVNFRCFKKIMEVSFPQTSDLQICDLFRMSYLVGMGCVTAESFFTVATEKNFFTQQLKLRGLIPIPQIDQKDFKIQYSVENAIYIHFYKYIESIPEIQIKQLNQILAQMGLEEVVKDLNQIKNLTKNQFQDIYNSRSLLMTTQKITNIWMKIRNIKLYHNQFKNNQNPLVQEYLTKNAEYIQMFPQFDKKFYCKQENIRIQLSSDLDVLKTDLLNISNHFNCLEKIEKQEKIIIFEKNLRVRNFQRRIKPKLSKFYGFVGSFIQSRVKAAQSMDLKEQKK